MHTILGAEILSSINGETEKLATSIALLHHEHFNGGGYWGYKAANLPTHIRIVSVADVYCALITKRVYKQPWTKDEAITYISNRAGTMFCPKIVNTFISIVSCNDMDSYILGDKQSRSKT